MSERPELTTTVNDRDCQRADAARHDARHPDVRRSPTRSLRRWTRRPSSAPQAASSTVGC